MSGGTQRGILHLGSKLRSFPLTESGRFQLLQVDREVQRSSLTVAAADGQRRGQPGGGGAQQGVLGP